ncbi:MAG: hypothetical protein K6A68_09780 [Clostridiales bacterium]|nr:hypothetical protein [Clostridiales bacterium]
MKNLEQLREIADRTLGGLNATPELRYAIQMKALKQQRRKAQTLVFAKIAAPSLCALLLLSLILFPSGKLGTSNPPSITSLPLGQLQDKGAEDVALIGEVAVSNTRRSSESGIWASSSTGSFPLLGVNGRYYRMIVSPSSVSSSSVGQSIGKVQEYTTEPSLSDTGIICSNCVNAGDDVYAYNGLSGTFVCAKVNGELRLFQRVSFNGHATIAHESLSDTLQLSGHIVSLSISGIGSVSDSAVAEELFSKLVQNASYESSGSIQTSSVLTINLKEGISAQMLVSDDRLAACGVWSCPEFISAFKSAVNQ